MRRFLMVVLVIVSGLAMVGWAHDNAETASAHDVERDGRDCVGGCLEWYPYIGFITAAEAIGGQFTITLQPGGMARSWWQCIAGQIGASQRHSNVNGTQARTFIVTSDTLHADQSDFAATDHCWYRVTAVSPDNVAVPKAFIITGSSYWIDLIDGSGDEEPDPEPSPTPTPAPSPTPTPGFVTETGQAACMTNTLRNSRWRNATTTAGRTGPAISPGDVVVMRLTIDLDLGQTFARDFRWTGSSADEPTAISFSGGNQAIANSGLWYLDGSGSTINAETNGEGTYWQGRTDLGQPERTVTVADSDTYLYCHASDNNGGTSSYNTYTVTWWINPNGSIVAPTPTPEPTPSASPTPTPIVGGVIGGQPGNGFDVCDPQYTASQKSMCQEFPEPPPPDDDDDIEVCPEGSNLAICEEQRVYNFGDPNANPDAVGDLVATLQEKAPFAYALEAADELQDGLAGASGGVADWCFDLTRWSPVGNDTTEVCIPIGAMASVAAPFRFVSLAVLTILFLVAIVKVLNKNAGAA